MTKRKFPICSSSHYSSYSWHQQSYGNLHPAPLPKLYSPLTIIFFPCQIHKSGTWEHFDQREIDWAKLPLFKYIFLRDWNEWES